jgi:serine protease Do
MHALDADLNAVVERARCALVQISNGAHGFGAGTIWHEDGLIITNAHVVAGHHGLKATLPDGRTLPAEILAYDESKDLAALRVDAHDLPTIELGRSKEVRPGEWVLAVGHPWGVQGAVTGGVIVGTGDDLAPVKGDWIAVSLRMRPGHSGGPLVDVSGRLLGVNTMIAGPGLGFAIPTHVVKAFLKHELTN